MSIVALKRNSERYFNPISAHGFSLNGGIRNLRPIGDTNLAWLTGPNASLCYANNPAIVKRSNKNTRGYLLTVLHPVCENGNCNATTQYTWVKDYSPLNHSQGIYLHNLNERTATNPGGAPLPLRKDDTGVQDCPCDVRKKYRIGGRVVWPFYYAKNPTKFGAVDQSTYIKSRVPAINCLPTPCNAQHFPPTVNNNGCNVPILTPQQAITAGLLPKNWTGKS